MPRAFDTFAVPGRREFDHQSLPGGGEFDPHALGVRNLNSTIDFMLACVASVSSRGSSRKLEQEQKKKKQTDGGGGGERRNRLLASPTTLKNCVRPRTQLLIGAVRVVLIN